MTLRTLRTTAVGHLITSGSLTYISYFAGVCPSIGKGSVRLEKWVVASPSLPLPSPTLNLSQSTYNPPLSPSFLLWQQLGPSVADAHSCRVCCDILCR